MARIYWQVQQGAPDWFRLRAGIPTASAFDQIVTPKKGEPAAARYKYACRLIAERLLRWQADSLDQIEHIEDGRRNEPFAVAQLQAVAGIETHRVGFVTTSDGRFGASPDRAIGGTPALAVEDGSLSCTVEVKSPSIPRQFEYCLLGQGDAYRCQVQGQLYVAEADKAIWYSYHPRMPACHVETGRDEDFIAKLRDGLERFSDELEEMTERAKGLGAFQAFAEIAAPAAVAYSEDLAEAIEPWNYLTA